MFRFQTKAMQVAGWIRAESKPPPHAGNRVLRVRAGGSRRLTSKPQRAQGKRKYSVFLKTKGETE